MRLPSLPNEDTDILLNTGCNSINQWAFEDNIKPIGRNERGNIIRYIFRDNYSRPRW
jgi:hypothetical protein